MVYIDKDGKASGAIINDDDYDVDVNKGPSIVALAPDPVNKRIFFSISSPKKGGEMIMSTTVGSNMSDSVPVVYSDLGNDDIQGLAYDVVGKSLYWTDSNSKAIFWANASEGSVAHSGKILHKLSGEQNPSGIVVDPCRRFVFWTNENHLSPSIERSNLDGTSRFIIVEMNLFRPVALALDMSGGGHIYWFDNSEGIHYKIEKSRLDGSERTLILRGQHHAPFAVAFTPASGKDKPATLIWSDWIHDAIWQLPLDSKSPKKVYHFEDVSPMGLITMASLNTIHSNETEELLCPKEEELEAIAETTSVAPQAENSTEEKAVNDSTNSGCSDNLTRSRVYPDFCINGEPIVSKGRSGGIKCECKPGFTGLRCETSICHNYCVHGSCGIQKKSDGHWEPKCECRLGFLGQRCDYNPCNGYCLNGGRCRIQNDGSPRCTCPGSGQLVLGERCERRLGLLEKMCAVRCSQEGLKITGFIPLESVNGEQDTEGPMCKCPSSPGKYIYINESPRANISSSEDRGKFASSDSPFVLVLGVLCIILLAVSVYLAVKVFSLRRLPRIKKRIIVSKGALPLAAGRGGPGSPGNQVLGEQQQCEITIENCCNMNICETPCFEPQLRSPGSSAVTNKNGKEEKKMLLANMEVPKPTCGPCQAADELY
ncbi:hypothetical protein J437_LFUL014342 [Ladona fulva]|uniref:Protein cueball n=1 Tax=Ladona fulva TaxID=123851 RepID=A0A8K0K3T2_LADFU|nr:hypothetical protein J437_LFUL014342 [Ladona fulva]